MNVACRCLGATQVASLRMGERFGWVGVTWLCDVAWHGVVEVCEGAPVAVSGWVLADRHDVRPCAASSLHRGTTSVSNVIGGTGTLGMAQARN